MNYRKFCLGIAWLFGCLFSAHAQYAEVYPTNWWVNMKMNNIQLLLKSNSADFNKQDFSISYPGIKLLKKNTFANGKYVALDISIAPSAKPGIVSIVCSNKGEKNTIEWPLMERRKGNGTSFAQGVTSADFIYLLIPDRFSDGDVSNDRVPGMRDQTLNRDSIYHRHGGDMRGIIRHLDYLQQLGVTALWMTPVLENDRTERTEHGYAFTNQYKIDARLGGTALYKELSDALHQHGMKLIQDAVYNHVDIDHILFIDKPDEDWFHKWPTYTGTSFKDQPVFDPYASAYDKKITTDGWFNRLMPDVNQSNPFVANYLIQNAIWCVEEFGVDGWRIDTYLYNDPQFMNRCNKALMDEYPAISLFGETWVQGVVSQAYFVENNMDIPFKSNLQGATDFQTYSNGIVPSLTQPFGWNEGVNRLYTTLAGDYLYKDPTRNVLFLDNHDLSRIFSVVGESVAKQKMGIKWLLTCRGIPQMYYGTEILMKGFTNPDGWVRLDFPGGWEGDKKNGFTGEGLSTDELSVQSLVKTLANFRKNSSALKTGKLMQYVPVDGLYVYFRYDDNQTIMCVMNTSAKEKEIDFNKYAERTYGFVAAKSITDDQAFMLSENQQIAPDQMWVLALTK
ncbi:MAG: cyclomaltodextrinase C-terminal domain-containing protein [Chitinophagaceae bacterium]|nr:cyclomaltodextrinase C-terminal domain-containing protein [Chitinophagaceae bacterium]